MAGSGVIEKQLLPTVDGEGRPPVRLLVVDTEVQEAAEIAKACGCKSDLVLAARWSV